MIRGFEPGRKPALVINECQLGVVDARYTDFAGLAEQVAARGVLPHIAALAQAFRTAGLPVIHTPVVHRPDLADIAPNSLINALTLKHRRMVQGSEEAGYVAELQPQPGDFEIVRSAGLIAFNGTTLDATLRRMGVTTVVLTGVSTNVAMPGNTTTAVDLGYCVILPEDCLAGSDAETHAVIMQQQLRLLATVTTSQEIIQALQQLSSAV